MMAKLLLISHASEGSGAPRYLVTTAIGLRERGYSLDLCFPTEGPMTEQARKLGFPVKIVPNPQLSGRKVSGFKKLDLISDRLSFSRKLTRLIRARKYDLIYISSYVNVFAGFAARRAGVPILWHIQECVEPGNINDMRIRVIKRWASALVFAASNGHRPFLPIPRRLPYYYIPNCVDLDKYAPAPEQREATRRNLDLATEDFALLSVGFVSYRKGFDLLLSAFSRVAQRDRDHSLKLLIAGEVPQSEQSFYQGLRRNVANDENLKGRVFFLGPRKDVPELLAACDLFVLASRNEAMPFVVVEAMAAGRPIVATAAGNLAQVLCEGPSGYVVPVGQVGALADGLEHLLKNEGMRQTLSRQARRVAEEKYGLDNYYSQIAKLVEKTLAKRKSWWRRKSAVSAE